jgi:hypothetical protein
MPGKRAAPEAAADNNDDKEVKEDDVRVRVVCCNSFGGCSGRFQP